MTWLEMECLLAVQGAALEKCKVALESCNRGYNSDLGEVYFYDVEAVNEARIALAEVEA